MGITVSTPDMAEEGGKQKAALEQLLPSSYLFSSLPGDLLTQQSVFISVSVHMVETLGLKQSKSQPTKPDNSKKNQKHLFFATFLLTFSCTRMYMMPFQDPDSEIFL